MDRKRRGTAAPKPAPQSEAKPARPRPASTPAPEPDDFGYSGKRLGLPEDGPGSLASTGRRLGALAIDWGLSYVIALAFLGHGRLNATGTSFGTLAVFAAENLLLISTLGYTVGKRVMGLRVVSVTRPYLTPLAVVLRTLLLCMVFPAAIWDRDGRGLHDKAVGTAVIRA